MLYSLEALHETENHKKALEVIKKAIKQAEDKPRHAKEENE